MPEYLRALVYVLTISIPVLYIAGRIAVPLIEEAEFRLWRNCWLAATCITFLSASFLQFSIAMMVMCAYIHWKSRQPAFLYVVLMFAAPCVAIGVGIPGLFNRVTDLDPPRLLGVILLLPLALKLWRDPENRVLRFHDVLLVLFFGFITILSTRFGDINSFLRAALGYILDIPLPYFVFSRTLRSAREINQVLLAFVVATMPLAAIGVFEITKNWRVYYVVVQQWDVVLITAYLFRDGLLRASTTSIEAISFGFLCMTGAGCLLALRTQSPLGIWRYAAFGVLLLGLLSSVSRGPWLGLAVCVAILLLANLRMLIKVVAAAIPAIIAFAIFQPALFHRFTNLLPFIGSADRGSETYRSRLFENSLIVIDRYPFFGNEKFLNEPEMMRMIQGQGIIDVVNTYLQIALYHGLVGLTLFGMFFGLLVARLAYLNVMRRTDLVNYQGVLALLIAMLFTIATTSSVSIIPYIYWLFSGICAALLTQGVSIHWEFGPKFRSTVMRTLGVGLAPSVSNSSSHGGKMHVLSPHS